MAERMVKVQGLNELLPKLDADFLVQPEVDDALASFEKRFKRQGKGVGAKRNTLTAQTEPLSLRVESTLEWPRTTGEAWGRKNERIAKGMAGRVLKKAVQRIEERWAARTGGVA